MSWKFQDFKCLIYCIRQIKEALIQFKFIVLYFREIQEITDEIFYDVSWIGLPF